MSATPNNWYVITGGPSTGKTTLLSQLEKLGHKVVPEAARTYIDEQLAMGFRLQQIRADEEKFQHEIVRMKVKIESELDKDALTFLDRGMHDTLAYLEDYSFVIEDWITEHMRSARYKQVFLLEPLATFTADHVRIEDMAFTMRLHRLLDKAYADFGMKPISVPAISPEQRASFVLDQIRTKEQS